MNKIFDWIRKFLAALLIDQDLGHLFYLILKASFNLHCFSGSCQTTDPNIDLISFEFSSVCTLFVESILCLIYIQREISEEHKGFGRVKPQE